MSWTTPDVEPLEHQSVWTEGHQDWRPGRTCDECVERKAQRKAELFQGQVMVSGLELMKDLEYGSTRDWVNDNVNRAVANGIEPEKVR